MRILIAGVNYAPEVTGIGPYTTGLAEHLAGLGHDVTVATTFPFAPLWRWFEKPPRWRTRDDVNGVEVWRTKILLPPRRTTAWRITFDSSIGLTSALTMLSIPTVDVAVCVSPPIQIVLAACAVGFKARKLVVLVQDLPTEAARSVGMLKDGLAIRIGRSLERFAYKRADHVVVVSNAFAKYVEAAGVPSERICEIPNWADVVSAVPTPTDQIMRARLGAGPRDFLVLYAGNMGAKQNLLNVVRAAALLKDETRVKIALIGDGQERAKVAEELAARRLDNINLLPLQPRSDFSAALGAADVLLISQAPGVVDSVLPSKLLTYMASGKPVVASVHPSSTAADLVLRARCGLLVNPAGPESLAAVLRSTAQENGHRDLTAMGRRGRAYVEEHFDRRTILRRWETLIGNVAQNQ